MKLYLISQSENNNYDTYDSAVVAAEDEIHASLMHPGGDALWYNGNWYWTEGDGKHPYGHSDWVPSPGHVEVEYLGETNRKAGVICASFNAG